MYDSDILWGIWNVHLNRYTKILIYIDTHEFYTTLAFYEILDLKIVSVLKTPSGLVVLKHYIMTSSNGNIFSVTGHLCGEFTGHRPVTRSFDVFFDLRLNKPLSKQSWGWWFDMPSRSLWRPVMKHR